MGLLTTVIDGAGITATHGAVALTEINTIAFTMNGVKEEINLTTVTNTYKVGLLSQQKKISDVTINKKVSLTDFSLSEDNAALVITFKTGRVSTKTLTLWAQVKDPGEVTLEVEPSDGINHDIVFFVTNLDASLDEIAPAIAST